MIACQRPLNVESDHIHLSLFSPLTSHEDVQLSQSTISKILTARLVLSFTKDVGFQAPSSRSYHIFQVTMIVDGICYRHLLGFYCYCIRVIDLSYLLRSSDLPPLPEATDEDAGIAKTGAPGHKSRTWHSRPYLKYRVITRIEQLPP